MTEFILSIIKYVAIMVIIIVGTIAAAIAIGAIIGAISAYIENNPAILEDLADTALVRCEIDRALSEVLDKVGVTQEQKLILHAMERGEKVRAGEVRSVADHAKNVVNAAKWNAICTAAGR